MNEDDLRLTTGYDIMERTTDIVVTTRKRFIYLTQTLRYLWERTRTPYRLTVVDDGSIGKQVDWLIEQFHCGRINSLVLKGTRHGAMANLNAGAWMTYSDPVVFVDDDILCPDIEPDWLSRGLVEMDRHGELAMLALRHPGAKVKPYDRAGNVVYCWSLGGTYCFMRRRFVTEHPLPHRAGHLAKPMEERCRIAHTNGWRIGYLSGVYCQHIGVESVLTGKKYGGRFIEPVDAKTLRPPEKYAD